MTKSKTDAGASKGPPVKTSTATAKTAPTKAKPATRTTARPRTATRGVQNSKARREAAAASLTPIRKWQSRDQIIASASAAAGIEPRTGRVFTRELMTVLKRHVVRGAVGRVDVPFLDAGLWRGTRAARAARTMVSGLLKREVKVPARLASPVPRFRAHRALREAVAGLAR